MRPSGVPRGGSVVALTDHGVAVHETWADLAAAADDRWHATVGNDRSERARQAAAAVVGQFDLEWPHYPVSYGTADPSVTGGLHTAAEVGPPRVPAHGQDWRPVTRDAPHRPPSDLPLYAVLAQALLQFASDYEAHGAGSLRTAFVLRDVEDGWVPLDDFPPAAHVTGSGRSGLERHGVVDVEDDPARAKAKLVRPSAIGRGIRDAYGPLTTRIEKRWRDAYGDDRVSELRAALDDLAADSGVGLPDFVIVTHLVS